MSFKHGRRVLSATLTTALAGTALFVMQGTSSAAPAAAGTPSPTEGSTTASTVVAVTGTGFIDAAGIKYVRGTAKIITGATCTDAAAAAGVSATSMGVVSATRIVVRVPSGHAAGATKICLPVTNAAGVHTANVFVAVPFTFALQPTAGALSFSAGPTYGGQTVAATSTVPWRAGSTSVTVGGVAATGVKVATGGASLSFVTPAESAGAAVNVVVRTPGFAPVTFAAAYTYSAALKVTPSLVDPAGDTISILGAGFEDATVYPNGVGVYIADGSGSEPECTNIAVVSDTEISCDLPAHAAAAVSIVVGDDVTPGTYSALANPSVVTSGSTVTFAAY